MALSPIQTDDDRPAVALVGGSPAWGDAVSRASQAVPARYAAVSQQNGEPLRVANLTCNGQLVADSYFLAKSAGTAGADSVIVQVTYHNFSPRGRDGARQRYPELPRLLGVRVTPQVAGILRAEPTPALDLTGAGERWLRAHWQLYGQREALAARTLGDVPEQRLFSASSKLGLAPAASGPPPDDGPSRVSFVETDPGMQSVMADEWARDADFTLSKDDSEVRMLRLLCEEIEREGTPVVVYLAPINLTGLRDMGMVDEPRLRANVRQLEQLVTSTGAQFVDLNSPRPLPARVFADINHTTAEGCDLTARRLYAAIHGGGRRP